MIVDLPDHEDEHFQLVTYGLLALRHLNNHGLRFRDFRVPRENLLQPAQGDGLTIAYHGLNLGRVALVRHGRGIDARDARQHAALGPVPPDLRRGHRLARAGAAADRPAGRPDRRLRRPGRLVLMAARPGLPRRDGVHHRQDLRQRGPERSGRRALHEDARRPRISLQGHLFGDNIHEYLAPCIYEGEGEMLGMAFFKSLIKEHGKQFFEPIGRAIQASGIKKPNPMNPAHAWALRSALCPTRKWRLGQMLTPQAARTSARHVAAAGPGRARRVCGRGPRARAGSRSADVMIKHQLRLADRQCRMAELSQRLQDLVVILATSLWAGRQSSEVVQAAADILCQDLTRKITGRRPTDAYFRAVTKLGEKVAAGGFEAIAGIEAGEILMPYKS